MRHLPDDDHWLPERRRAIGARIRAVRLHQNLSQDQVWLAAGLTRWTYQRAEYGEEVQISTLIRIAWVLDVPLADLVL